MIISTLDSEKEIFVSQVAISSSPLFSDKFEAQDIVLVAQKKVKLRRNLSHLCNKCCWPTFMFPLRLILHSLSLSFPETNCISLSRATIVWRRNSWNFGISKDFSNQGLSYGTIAICTYMYLCSHVLWKYEIMIFFADCSSRVTPIWRHFSWNGESLNANHWDCKSFPFMRYRENAGNLLSPLYQSIYIHSDRD